MIPPVMTDGAQLSTDSTAADARSRRPLAQAVLGLRRLALAFAAAVPLAVVGAFAVAPAGARIAAGGGAGSRAGALALTFLAMILILVASRLRGTLLGGLKPGPLGVAAADLIGAYSRATIAGFALLATAAGIGAAVAFLSGAARDGVVVALASGVAMAVRWPRLGELERLARRLSAST